MKNQPFLSINNITIRIADKFFFKNTSWQMHRGEQWLFFGPNGSGKSTLAKAIAGILPTKQGEIILHFVKDQTHPYPSVHKNEIVYLSFETQQQFLNKDSLQRDLEAYIGKEQRGTLVKDYVSEPQGISQSYLLRDDIFTMNHLLDREVATLSTGEMRKVFLVKAFLQQPKLLILDEPFDGLDKKSKTLLMHIIDEIMKQTQIIFIVHSPDEIPKNITHILLVKDCAIFDQGEKEEIAEKYNLSSRGAKRREIHLLLAKPRGISLRQMADRNDKIIIQLKNITVRYGNNIILNNINWTLREGENWAILGPNGAGKTTLMHLITGDHQQAYANNITLFGKKKDTGISIWEKKEKIGVVSTDLMIKYQKTMSAYDVICSGLFDSIGLYKKIDHKQRKVVNKWIQKLNLEKIVEKNYHELSFGQKRLILIARAVVKSPTLLFLDEPCHGLDMENRKNVLNMIQTIGNSKKTHIILITHSQDEIVPSITHILELKK